MKHKKEASKFALELRKIEEKDKVTVNTYAMFQIREAVGRLQMIFKIGFHKNFANFIEKALCWTLF